MTTFKDKTWAEREKTLGDPAETAFKIWADDNDIGYVRYGLERPPLDMRTLPTMIRYTPDFLTEIGLIEVQGCGQDNLFKFKHDKLGALADWACDVHDVKLWLYHQPSGEDCLTSLEHILVLCSDVSGLRHDGKFDGHKPYSTVHWDKLKK